MKTVHEPLLLDKVLYSEISWTYLQVLFESLFSLTELLNMTVVWNFAVMLGQTLKHFVWNSVILFNVIILIIDYLVIVKSDTTFFNRYDDGIFWSPNLISCFSFINYILNIRDINTTDEK
jgi:hypothetical protein